MLDDDLDITRRLRAGADGIRPRNDAVHVVREQVVRRRRRRRVTTSVVAAAAAVLVVGGSTVALSTLADRDSAPRLPADQETSVAELPRDGRRPVAFFVELVGGRGAAKTNAFRPTSGERLNSQFNWWPGNGTGAYPVFGGIAVERYGSGEPSAACAEQATELGEGATCTDNAAGDTVLAFDGTVETAYTDPFHRLVRFGDGFGDADPDDLVRRATVLRSDGWAVSLSICACSAIGPDLPEPPVDIDRLAEAAADDAWIFQRGDY